MNVAAAVIVRSRRSFRFFFIYAIEFSLAFSPEEKKKSPEESYARQRERVMYSFERDIFYNIQKRENLVPPTYFSAVHISSQENNSLIYRNRNYAS